MSKQSIYKKDYCSFGTTLNISEVLNALTDFKSSGENIHKLK